jgi:VIT1/CCC1 family predicted Fe2+/Mn2+ transporter
MNSRMHTHTEHHFAQSELVRDIVIGMSDGLTVPFALAAGLSGVAQGTHLVVLAGLAEIAAGATAMGLGGYLAARGDAEHYGSERRREEQEVVTRLRDEEEEIYEIFEAYNVDRVASGPVLEALKRNPEKFVDFMMRFELGLDEPEPGRAPRSASTIAAAYVVGGLVPLAPYMLMPTNHAALPASVAFTLVALLVFGGLKGRLTETGMLRGAVQTTVVGGLAAAIAYGLARGLNGR